MVNKFGKCTGSHRHTVVDPMAEILIQFMHILDYIARSPQCLFTYSGPGMHYGSGGL